MDLVETIRQKYEQMSGLLDERSRRIWAASEAKALGRGGIIRVAEATGMSRTTIIKACKELNDPEKNEGSRPRTRKGTGKRP